MKLFNTVYDENVPQKWWIKKNKNKRRGEVHKSGTYEFYLKIFSSELLQTLPKTQSEIDISPFLKTQKRKTRGGFLCFCVLINCLINRSCSTLFIMKTSHTSDEIKNKKGGSTNRVHMIKFCQNHSNFKFVWKDPQRYYNHNFVEIYNPCL